MKIKYVGFDKDGTLMDSMGAYGRIWGEIFYNEYGIDQKEAEDFLLKTAGQPTVVQVNTLLKSHNISLSKEDVLKKAYEIGKTLAERAKSKPFPEVAGILRKLKEDGYKIFVSSGQQEDIVRNDLERSGLLEYVDFYAGIKPEEPEFKKGEPHFRAAAKHFGVPFEAFAKETIFIGDTPTDVEVSKDSNIISIVRKSSNADESLLKNGAKYVVDDFTNLPGLIKEI